MNKWEHKLRELCKSLVVTKSSTHMCEQPFIRTWLMTYSLQWFFGTQCIQSTILVNCQDWHQATLLGAYAFDEGFPPYKVQTYKTFIFFWDFFFIPPINFQFAIIVEVMKPFASLVTSMNIHLHSCRLLMIHLLFIQMAKTSQSWKMTIYRNVKFRPKFQIFINNFSSIFFKSSISSLFI